MLRTGRAGRGRSVPGIETGRPLVFLACAIILIDSVGYGVVVPLLPLYSRELGVSEFGLGFLFASYAIALLLAAVPLGLLSDRIGRKPLVLFGMFGTMVASVLYAYSGTYLELLGA
ncbi:MAG: MFS transporter, partial [Planctomycetes bacterium]|nr:MFS transporter [Planctomycetota bacterium]